MSRRVTTRWYTFAWLVEVAAFIVLVDTGHLQPARVYLAGFGASAASTVPWLVIAIATLVMVVTWIGALVQLGRARAWGWFAAVLVLQVLGLGILGMAAYAIAGPADLTVEAPVRPSFT